ncbi:nucleotide sugar dehydrogenase [Reichenbachiella sp. MALMAid0571]|uniref:nucleotide sugar dehydrogenase n=1 Tax=Reichenbachiella sp. MALMAid0571 TaxID=3143939 RepID=UPI0032DE5B01
MNHKVAIIGMGYVGLPLAIEAAKKYPVLGFDIKPERLEELNKGFDRTKEVSNDELAKASNLKFSHDPNDLNTSNFYIVTVPTPIDVNNKPDLKPLISASRIIGSQLTKGDIVVFESTVYPGCTEEDCVPVMEAESGLKYNIDFFCGYSPERINPGDKNRRVTDIKKVTSGSNEEIATVVDDFYKSIIKAGTHKASSIKVAEASKVIENAQRDINIAFVNELALVFEKMNLNTLEVLEAAGTKWNFLPFRPGLVGGHCIGVDPYYLTHKADSLGYHAEVILAGRRINDNMGRFIATQVVKMIVGKGINVSQSKILVMGITFKENCPDIRNSKVFDIIKELKSFNIHVDAHDPEADREEVKTVHNIDLVENIDPNYNAIIVAVSHSEYSKIDWTQVKTDQNIIYDIKGILPKGLADITL